MDERHAGVRKPVAVRAAKRFRACRPFDEGSCKWMEAIMREDIKLFCLFCLSFLAVVLSLSALVIAIAALFASVPNTP